MCLEKSKYGLIAKESNKWDAIQPAATKLPRCQAERIPDQSQQECDQPKIKEPWNIHSRCFIRWDIPERRGPASWRRFEKGDVICKWVYDGVLCEKKQKRIKWIGQACNRKSIRGGNNPVFWQEEHSKGGIFPWVRHQFTRQTLPPCVATLNNVQKNSDQD